MAKDEIELKSFIKSLVFVILILLFIFSEEEFSQSQMIFLK